MIRTQANGLTGYYRLFAIFIEERKLQSLSLFMIPDNFFPPLEKKVERTTQRVGKPNRTFLRAQFGFWKGEEGETEQN